MDEARAKTRLHGLMRMTPSVESRFLAIVAGTVFLLVMPLFVLFLILSLFAAGFAWMRRLAAFEAPERFLFSATSTGNASRVSR